MMLHEATGRSDPSGKKGAGGNTSLRESIHLTVQETLGVHAEKVSNVRGNPAIEFEAKRFIPSVPILKKLPDCQRAGYALFVHVSKWVGYGFCGLGARCCTRLGWSVCAGDSGRCRRWFGSCLELLQPPNASLAALYGPFVLV